MDFVFYHLGTAALKDFVAKMPFLENRIAEYLFIFEKRKAQRNGICSTKDKNDECLNRHTHNFLIGAHQTVTNGDNGLQCNLGGRHCLDNIG